MNLIKVDPCCRRGVLAAVGHHLHIDELQQGHHGNRAELVAQTLDIKANQAVVHIHIGGVGKRLQLPLANTSSINASCFARRRLDLFKSRYKSPSVGQGAV